MAIYVFGLVASDISVPGRDASEIGASTEPLATGDLTQAIEDGAAQINSLLDRSGITPQSVAAGMDEDSHGMCVAAIKAYAQADALRIIGDTGPRYEAAWQQWLGLYGTISARPDNLGDAYTDGLTCNVDSITSGTAIDAVGDDEFDFIGFSSKIF